MMKYIFLFALGITAIAATVTFVLAPRPQPHLESDESESGPYIIYPSETSPNGTPISNTWTKCEVDIDCFAGECCHPRFCINGFDRPNCREVFCTQDCRKGTMDCSCGSCVCVNGKCGVKLSESDFCL
jgi:hypothetical protein